MLALIQPVGTCWARKGFKRHMAQLPGPESLGICIQVLKACFKSGVLITFTHPTVFYEDSKKNYT